MTSRLSHPFVDTALVWTQVALGVWRATFNHLAIGGYDVHFGAPVGLPNEISRVWFGSAKMTEPLSTEPPVTEEAAKAWIEATFREWVRLAADSISTADALAAGAGAAFCPTCGIATYRSDGVAACTDHDPNDDGRPIEDDGGDPHEEQAWP